MDRILVTGGAGLHRLELRPPRRGPHRRPRHGARQADVRRQPRRRWPGCPRTGSSFVGRHRRRRSSSTALVAEHDAVVHYAAESHNDNSLHDPLAVPAHQPHRHLHAARGGAPARHPLPPHLHRRGVRRPRARRPGAVHRAHAVQPVAARTPRRRPARTCWSGPGCARFGVRATISNCSNNYGPYQHVEKFIPRQITNVIDGIRPKLYGARRERPRLDPRRRPQLRGAARSSSGAGSARPT